MFQFYVMWNKIIVDPPEQNVDINDATGVINIIINAEILIPVVNYLFYNCRLQKCLSSLPNVPLTIPYFYCFNRKPMAHPDQLKQGCCSTGRLCVCLQWAYKYDSSSLQSALSHCLTVNACWCDRRKDGNELWSSTGSQRVWLMSALSLTTKLYEGVRATVQLR